LNLRIFLVQIPDYLAGAVAGRSTEGELDYINNRVFAGEVGGNYKTQISDTGLDCAGGIGGLEKRLSGIQLDFNSALSGSLDSFSPGFPEIELVIRSCRLLITESERPGFA
jgi:hypothetical protein